ncbi:hypothetical protein PIB30_024550 [Stylosanthes scabra]|uniref:Uncharacterized protein n=1 Tax=Stylosanthes scabra TaxID=79078 RepID=A0ABU6SAI3_9FABA|nr:hypothetical protein [Stylosanthes scabra]
MAENPEGGQEAVTAEAVEMPRELSTLYQLVAPDVLGAPPILSQAYLEELKRTRVIFGGGELEHRYKVELKGTGVLYEPGSPDEATLAVGERSNVHRVWHSGSIYRLSVAPPEPGVRRVVAASPKRLGIYPMLRAGDRVAAVATRTRDSFHDFKGRFFKILPIGTHRPFWLSLEGDGRFPSYWTDMAGFDVAPVTYMGLRAHKKEIVDVLTSLVG